MNKFYYLVLILLLSFCSSKGKDDPLIIPPNFAEMPDLKNIEAITPQERDENIIRLKELLLQSEEG